MHDRERFIRQRLGIPDAAERVLIFGESSHWDPNWLKTSEEYYAGRIVPILEEVVQALEQAPNRVYAIESLFFFKMFWERQPDLRPRLAALIDRGQLRFLSCGLTSPDTNLPDAEAIIRDFLLGHEWLASQGLQTAARMAYLPDSFGHSPELPALLSAMGLTRVALSRIDGMYFVASDYRRRSAFPLPGSSAELLQKRHQSLDFVWQASDGSEVLAHWNAFTYFQGDMLAHKGIIRWMGKTVGVSWRTAGHVARRVAGYVDQLAPLAKTPYLFCPIGCDFNGPIPELTGLLDRYNRQNHSRTGTFVVNAGLDDYLDLVDCRRDQLPRLRLDPNPYWMGQYASRPEIKQRVNRLTRSLLDAEGVANGNGPAIRSAWEILAISNHHDFITGTSGDRIWQTEQRPWLDRVQDLVQPAPVAFPPQIHGGQTLAWKRDGDCLRIYNGLIELVFSDRQGGCLISWKDAVGRECLHGPANDLILYRDSGGLWRLGHEYRGGVFKQRIRASQLAAQTEVHPHQNSLEIRCEFTLGGQTFGRQAWIHPADPFVYFRTRGIAPLRTSVVCGFICADGFDRLDMDVPGGIVQRPAIKIHRPTFWPARTFAHLRHAGDSGLAVLFEGPAAISTDESGAVEWMLLRNAPREKAFGFLPVLAHPVRGSDPGCHAIDYAVGFTSSGDWRDNNLFRQARQLFGPVFGNCPIDLAGVDALVTAIKPASDGNGVIARIQLLGRPGRLQLTWKGRPLVAACLCDALERDETSLNPHGNKLEFQIKHALTSLRLAFEPGSSFPGRSA